MNWYDLLNETIDMRTFSNLWFWIALAVLWSSVSHYILGVPYDMVVRAARKEGAAQQDLEDMVRVNVNRMMYISGVAGLWLLGMGCFILTTLALLGFIYDIHLAQALFLMGFPLALIGLHSLNTAHLIRERQLLGDALRRKLGWHRFWTQVIAMLSVFVTALWGMYQNLSAKLPDDIYSPRGEVIQHDQDRPHHDRGRTRGI